MCMSTDSEDEDLCSLKEATDDLFLNAFRAKNCRANLDTFPEDRKKLHHSLQYAENEQYKLFEVTPQFRDYVAKALTNKLNESIDEILIEYPVEKRKSKKKGCIKLLKSSACPLDMNNSERDNVLNDSSTHKYNCNSRKVKLRNCDQALDVINSVAISSDDILNFTDIKYWSNRSKAQVFRYSKDAKGILNTYLE